MWVNFAWLALVGTVGYVLVRATARLYDAYEFRIVQASFLAHLVSTLAHIYIATQIYGAADMFMYHEFASDLSRATREDPSLFSAIGMLIVHIDPELSLYVPVAGGTVGAMVSFTSLACLLTNDSFWGAGAVFAVVSVFGKLLLYEGMRTAVPERAHRLALGVFLVPSAVFWTGGIIKEAVAMGGLGVYFLGAALLVERRRWGWGLALAIAGAVPIYAVKPYILAAAGLGTIAWVYAKRAQLAGELIRPFSLVGLGVVGLGFLYGIGKVVPRIALDRVVDEAARMQEAGYSGRGSAYTLSPTTSSSASGQALLLPIALFTGLYRPGLWESSNGLMLANALEATVFLFATVQGVVRTGIQRILELVREWPVMMFLVVFVGVMGVATGLTSANLGTLSRYRMPLLPFFACFLLLLHSAPRAQRALPKVP